MARCVADGDEAFANARAGTNPANRGKVYCEPWGEQGAAPRPRTAAGRPWRESQRTLFNCPNPRTFGKRSAQRSKPCFRLSTCRLNDLFRIRAIPLVARSRHRRKMLWGEKVSPATLIWRDRTRKSDLAGLDGQGQLTAPAMSHAASSTATWRPSISSRTRARSSPLAPS
jgi:hypothetical protein